MGCRGRLYKRGGGGGGREGGWVIDERVERQRKEREKRVDCSVLIHVYNCVCLYIYMCMNTQLRHSERKTKQHNTKINVHVWTIVL